ncbi:MAG: hypothetical protein JNM75_05190 [Rhodospirillales bacterium]|nr:hypothetical protein [Rhodospirillales bacterium]
MLDVIDFSLKVQQTAVASALGAIGAMAATWMRLMKGEFALLGQHIHQRSEELHAGKGLVPTGPQWTDHYGNRSRDVDVEHLR